MAHARIRKGLRGRSKLVRSQFDPRSDDLGDDLDSVLKRTALKLAKEAMTNAREWINKKEVTWALVEARRAVKLLEVVGGE